MVRDRVTLMSDATLLDVFDDKLLTVTLLTLLSCFYYPLQGPLTNGRLVTIQHCYTRCYNALYSPVGDATKIFFNLLRKCRDY